jgi:hypothetical protein
MPHVGDFNFHGRLAKYLESEDQPGAVALRKSVPGLLAFCLICLTEEMWRACAARLARLGARHRPAITLESWAAGKYPFRLPINDLETFSRVTRRPLKKRSYVHVLSAVIMLAKPN